MRRRIRNYVVAFTLVTIWLLGPGANKAQAYIDPGTGSSILGSIGIILAVCSAFAAVAFQHVRGFFSWAFGKIVSIVRKPARAEDSAPKTT